MFQKTEPLDYFDDNFGKYGPILTIFSLLQQEIYDAQKLSYFSHLTCKDSLRDLSLVSVI